MMQTFRSPEGKSARENLARAKAALRGGRFVTAMDHAEAALKTRAQAKLIGQDRLETDFQIAEFCDEFSGHPGVKAFLREIRLTAAPFIRYEKGNVDLVLGRLGILKRRMTEKADEVERKRAAHRLKEKEEWLKKAAESLAAKEYPKGKVYLRRAADKYGAEEGVLTEVGRRMLEAGLLNEAAEVLSEAMEAFPRDSLAYKHLIEAFVGLGEYEKAEAIYLAGLKQFGVHPQTYLNMSKFYVTWRKRDEAFDYARRALQLDSELAEAREIVERYS